MGGPFCSVARLLATAHLEGIEFLLSATLVLSARMVNQQLNRSLRIAKLRGSGHVADELPMIMDEEGIQLPYNEHLPVNEVVASNERLSTGINRLDKLLDGGIYRGSSLLISGRPGTAKSTLAGSFAEAAARRGERTLYVSFDEMEAPYVRNLSSVGIELRGPIEAGLVKFEDLSAYALRVTEHLIDLVRRRGITTVLTSLSGVEDPEGEATLGQVSTLADSWIVLDYNVRGGERNRSLSIVKSRGSAHSNQERELLLSNKGVDLADVYELGSEVLMGTARATREREDAAAERRRQLERKQRRLDIERRMEQVERERRILAAELELEKEESAETDHLERVQRQQIKQRRDPEQENPPVHAPSDKGGQA